MQAVDNLPQVETIHECPVCSSSNKVVWSEATDLLTQATNQMFEYSTCLDCGVLYMSTRPAERDVSFFYTANYHPYQTKRKASLGMAKVAGLKQKIRDKFKLLRINFKLSHRIKHTYERDGHSKVFVDFGCGAGKQLNQQRTYFWETVGVDFSPIAVDAALGNGHQGYLVADFFDNFKNASVDMVRMNHVVEHLYHPRKVLESIASKMKSNAVLHIAVPNPSGVSAIFFKRNWHGLDCPRHVVLYPPETLVNMLESCGFAKCEVLQEAIAKDFIRSFGYLMASYGLIPLEKVNNLMHSKLLNLLFFVPALMASKLGWGDRYHIFCTKK